MKIVIALIFLSVYAAHLSFVSEDKNSGFLSQQEWQSLNSRGQQATIINANNASALQLLKSRSRVINVNDPHMSLLIKQMQAAVIANHGLGLAAVQIGIPVRVVLMKQHIYDGNDFQVYINPTVLYKSKSTRISRESCLSLPGLEMHLIKRAKGIKISYQTIQGKTKVVNLRGIKSAIFQQEMDHLNGVLIDDYPLYLTETSLHAL